MPGGHGSTRLLGHDGPQQNVASPGYQGLDYRFTSVASDDELVKGESG